MDGKNPCSENNCVTSFRRCSNILRWLASPRPPALPDGVHGDAPPVKSSQESPESVLVKKKIIIYNLEHGNLLPLLNESRLKSGPKKVVPTNLFVADLRAPCGVWLDV